MLTHPGVIYLFFFKVKPENGNKVHQVYVACFQFCTWGLTGTYLCQPSISIVFCFSSYTHLLKMLQNTQAAYRMAHCHPLKEKDHMAPAANGLRSQSTATDLTVVEDKKGEGKEYQLLPFSSALNLTVPHIRTDVCGKLDKKITSPFVAVWVSRWDSANVFNKCSHVYSSPQQYRENHFYRLHILQVCRVVGFIHECFSPLL